MKTLFVLVVMAVGSAQAGVTLTFERAREGKTTQTVLQLEGAKLRAETASEARGPGVMVWDGETKTALMIRPADKQYAKIDEATMAGAKDKLKAAREKMDAQMAKMPPEQRAQMEQMMKSRSAGPAAEKPEVKITATGKKLKVGPYDCQVYERVVADRKSEVCIVPWAKSPISKDELKPFVSLAEFTASMFGPMSGEVQEETMGEVEKYQGFPVQTVSTDSTGVTSTFTLKSATRGAVDKAAFSIPAGYTEKKTPM